MVIDRLPARGAPSALLRQRDADLAVPKKMPNLKPAGVPCPACAPQALARRARRGGDARRGGSGDGIRGRGPDVGRRRPVARCLGEGGDEGPVSVATKGGAPGAVDEASGNGDSRLGGAENLGLGSKAGDVGLEEARGRTSNGASSGIGVEEVGEGLELGRVIDFLVLISPFFFWGTSMAVMKVAAPHTSPLFVGTVRLIPAGALVLSWAMSQGRPQISGMKAWLAVAAFALVDGACFQGFLAEGLQRTTAGLGSIIIDSQPITVAVLAAALYGETLTPTSVFGLVLGIMGLGLLEVPGQFLSGGPRLLVDNLLAAGGGVQSGSIWDSGEWWMLLAAQSMAVGTVMVRWLSKFCDPVVATGWHMILGGVPLLVLSLNQESPELFSHLQVLNWADAASLAYITVFGSALSYGVFFENASRGNLTALSSLTFLTPVFAVMAGYLALGETLTAQQLVGAAVTLGAVFLITTSRSKTDQ